MTNATQTMFDFVACWTLISNRIFFASLGIQRDRGAAGAPYELVAIRTGNGRIALLWLVTHPTDVSRYIFHSPDFSRSFGPAYEGRKLRAFCKGQWLSKQAAHDLARSLA